jgi:hypothetical protein
MISPFDNSLYTSRRPLLDLGCLCLFHRWIRRQRPFPAAVFQAKVLLVMKLWMRRI